MVKPFFTSQNKGEIIYSNILHDPQTCHKTANLILWTTTAHIMKFLARNQSRAEIGRGKFSLKIKSVFNVYDRDRSLEREDSYY